jgi:cell division initiation protein
MDGHQVSPPVGKVNMKLTSMDIQQQQFKVRFRGFDVREVDRFLDQMEDAFSQLEQRLSQREEALKNLEQEKKEYKEREETFNRAMLNSQKILEQMKDNARRTAEIIVAEAEVKAEKILNRAHESLSKLHEDIAELKRQRIQIEVQLRSVIEAHTKLLNTSIEGVDTMDEEHFKIKVVNPQP